MSQRRLPTYTPVDRAALLDARTFAEWLLEMIRDTCVLACAVGCRAGTSSDPYKCEALLHSWQKAKSNFLDAKNSASLFLTKPVIHSIELATRVPKLHELFMQRVTTAFEAVFVLADVAEDLYADSIRRDDETADSWVGRLSGEFFEFGPRGEFAAKHELLLFDIDALHLDLIREWCAATESIPQAPVMPGLSKVEGTNAGGAKPKWDHVCDWVAAQPSGTKRERLAAYSAQFPDHEVPTVDELRGAESYRRLRRRGA